MLLQPTSPFRSFKSIDKSINILKKIKISTQYFLQKKSIVIILIKCSELKIKK